MDKNENIQIVSLKMVKDKKIKGFSEIINSPAKARDLFKKFIGEADREYLVGMYLDTKNQITALHIISIGSLNSSIIHPREVFKVGILSNSASVILSHNHPSTVCNPSKEDLQVSKRIKEAGEILGIELLDHIIVGGDNYYSLKENGLI